MVISREIGDYPNIYFGNTIKLKNLFTSYKRYTLISTYIMPYPIVDSYKSKPLRWSKRIAKKYYHLFIPKNCEITTYHIKRTIRTIYKLLDNN